MSRSASVSTNARPRLSRVRRVRLVVLAVLIALPVTGFTYQAISRKRDERRYPPPGQLVDVGGFDLHVNVAGEANDGLTVILEHGGGSFSAQWGWVQPRVAEFTQVVSYDRPGLGWSEPSPQPLTATEEADLLRTALGELDIAGPYVFVGHSMGGLLARSFAARYPDEVAGMVLVDPRPVSWEVVFPEGGGEVNKTLLRVIGIAARFGIVRLSGIAEDGAAGLPEQQFNETVAKTTTQRHFQQAVKDGEVGDSAVEVILDQEDLGEMPIIVLSAEEADDTFDSEARPRLTASHVEMAELSTRGEQRTVPGATHITIVTHEDTAEATVDAVRDMLVMVS